MSRIPPFLFCVNISYPSLFSASLLDFSQNQTKIENQSHIVQNLILGIDVEDILIEMNE